MESPRLTRALQMASLLKGGHTATARELAHVMGCSRRTIYRDIQLLRESGYPVDYDDVLGAYVARPSESPLELATAMDEDELAAVMLAASVSSLATFEALAPAVQRGLAVLSSQLPDGVREKFNRLERSVILGDEPPPAVPPDRVEVFRDLVHGIGKRERLWIGLRRSADAPRRSSLAVYQLRGDGRLWRVIGHCAAQQRTVELLLDDIARVESAGESYVIPEGYVRAAKNGSPP